MAELGRAACPAPMWSAALANLSLSDCQAEAASCVCSDKLHDGTARVAFSFGALDPDRQYRHDRSLSDGRASGLLRFVEVAASCTHLVVRMSRHLRVPLSSLDGPGVELEATRAMGAWGLYEVRLKQRRRVVSI